MNILTDTTENNTIFAIRCPCASDMKNVIYKSSRLQWDYIIWPINLFFRKSNLRCWMIYDIGSEEQKILYNGLTLSVQQGEEIHQQQDCSMPQRLNERCVINAMLLRSLFRLSVRLYISLSVAHLSCLQTEDFLQNLFSKHDRQGIWLGYEKQGENIRNRFSHGVVM